MSESKVAVWPELKLPHGVKPGTRIAPHVLVRTSVFSTLEYSGAAKRPLIHKSEPLPLDGMSQYRAEQLEGHRLSQSDADLLFWLLARAYRDGAPKDQAVVFFKRGEALTALGRIRGGKTDNMLDQSLQRLRAAEFNFEEKYEDKGMLPLSQTRLLSRVDRANDDTKHYDYRVTIADGVAELLRDGSWVLLSSEVREELASDPLAKGLYALFESNEIVHPTKPETLQRGMGRGEVKDARGEPRINAMQPSKWLFALRRALARVQSARGWLQCEVAQEGLHAGKVVVTKGGQRRRPVQRVV